MATVIKDMVTWLKQWFYTEDEIDTKLGNKANKNLGTANYNVVTDSSGDITVEAKPTIPSKISDLTNDSDFIEKSSTAGLVKNDGTIDTTSYSTFDGNYNSLSNKPTDVSSFKDANAGGYTNISSSLSSTSTQADINSAINTKIGTLMNLDWIVVVTTLPTASSSTMGKLYLVAISGSGDNNFKEYVTVKQGSTYSWEKLGEISGSGLSVDWSDITNKPSSYTPASHTHGSVTNDGKIGSTSGKPIITGTDGVLQAGAFGNSAGSFCEGNDARLSDSRTPTSHAHGNISNDGKVGSTSGKPLITTTGGAVTTGAFGTSSGQFAEGNHSHSDKADKTATLGTTITLVDKGETNEGCIIFNTIS